MFFSSKPKIIPMTNQHLNSVLSVIHDHDEDDAEAASSQFENEGVAGHFVLVQGKQVLGVSGTRKAAQSEGCHWLSWSYIHVDHQGQGLGVMLVKFVIQRLYGTGARKLFVAASDYRDESGTAIYARAHRFYSNMGFEAVLTLPDYYARGEARLISEIDFRQPAAVEGSSWSASAGFQCSDAFEMLESDAVYALAWELDDEGNNATRNQVEGVIDGVRSKGGQRIYVGLPADANGILAVLEQLGFENLGELKDYYRPGVGEVNLTLAL